LVFHVCAVVYYHLCPSVFRVVDGQGDEKKKKVVQDAALHMSERARLFAQSLSAEGRLFLVSSDLSSRWADRYVNLL
ncbi:UNVERIFIED_CONTAM: hypothetical protein PO554_26630, partial [Klebsiella pneumoniae]